MICRNEKNNKLYFLKGIACSCVVFIHVIFPGVFGKIIVSASGYAVPVFFMISGYYAYGVDSSTIKRRIKKLLIVFFLAYTLYFIYNFVGSVKNHELIQFVSNSYRWDTPIKYVVFCTVNFAIPLWYLIAMLETYLFWLFVVNVKKEHVALKITPMIFFLQIILTMYCETMQLEWFWKVNFFTSALPWFMMGYFLNTDKANIIRSLDNSILMVAVVIGLFLAVLPSAFDYSIKFSVIGYVPYASGVFILALKNPSEIINKTVGFIGEKLSLNIYIFHPLIRGTLELIVHKLLRVNTETDLYLWIEVIT